MGLKLNIPDHSHISRRAKTLSVVIPCRVHNEPLHVVIDFTGLKVYGEGEWKVRLFESSKLLIQFVKRTGDFRMIDPIQLMTDSKIHESR
ncbi:hypothetical protein BCS42_00685 [Crenothrix sp. D3]|nr:hypothetical protein BCS42_00685 [Crenothrix sp. D3]